MPLFLRTLRLKLRTEANFVRPRIDAQFLFRKNPRVWVARSTRFHLKQTQTFQNHSPCTDQCAAYAVLLPRGVLDAWHRMGHRRISNCGTVAASIQSRAK